MTIRHTTQLATKSAGLSPAAVSLALAARSGSLSKALGKYGRGAKIANG